MVDFNWNVIDFSNFKFLLLYILVFGDVIFKMLNCFWFDLSGIVVWCVILLFWLGNVLEVKLIWE